jgi:hypothetical protein
MKAFALVFALMFSCFSICAQTQKKIFSVQVQAARKRTTASEEEIRRTGN